MMDRSSHSLFHTISPILIGRTQENHRIHLMIGDHKAEIQTQDFRTVTFNDKVVRPNAEDIQKGTGKD
jgi:hypothetical protein